MHTSRLLYVLGILSLAGSQARAVTVLTANITREQETSGGTTALLTSGGGTRPMSSGTAVFTLNDAQTELSFTATIFNIDVTGNQTPNDTNDNLVSAHIHAAAVIGVNAGVRWGFFGAPDNDTAPDNLVVTPFVEGVGGTFTSIWNAAEGNNTTLADQLSAILGGQAYINFHTGQFNGGEIRGQIVPEPGSSALFLGAGLLTLSARRRRR